MPEKSEQETLLDESMLAEPGKWYRAYEKLPEDQRYDWMMETLGRTLTPDFLEEVSFVECLFELPDRNNPAKYAELILKLRNYPDFYRKEFHYFEDELAAYYLFLDEEDKVAESLRYYMEDPVQGSDQLLRLAQTLIYYGKTNMAVECARRTYEIIKTSPALIGGAGAPLAQIMFMWLYQQAYLRSKHGQEVDRRSLQEELERYDFITDGEDFARNCSDVGRLASEDNIRLNDDPTDARHSLSLFARDNLWMFVKQMHDRKQMDFPLGETIWGETFRFLQWGRKSSDSIREDGFVFSERKLETWLARMAGAFLSTQQADTFAALWGMPYVYDFLLEHGVISEQTHRGALRRFARLKTKMRNAHKDELWKYAFVDRWPASDYAEQEYIQADDHEEDDPDLNDDDDYDPYDDDDGYDGMFNPLYGSSPGEHRGGDSAKVKQKKKKARKAAKKQRKKNRR